MILMMSRILIHQILKLRKNLQKIQKVILQEAVFTIQMLIFLIPLLLMELSHADGHFFLQMSLCLNGAD